MRGEWHQEALRLVAEGVHQSEVARRVGVSPSAVSKLLHPEARARYNARTLATRDRERHREVDLAWRAKARGPCTRCGGERGRYQWNKGICGKCRVELDREAREARRRRIAAMWAEGALLREIAAALDSTTTSIGVEINRMRRDGWDVPLRLPPRTASARQLSTEQTA